MTRPIPARAPPPAFRSSWEPGQHPEPVPDEMLRGILAELLKMGVALLVVACVLATLLLLGGCATTSADCSNLALGVCKISGTRLLTDSGITLTTPQGLNLAFSSKPDQAGTQAALQALSGTVGVLVKIITGGVVPGVHAPLLDERGVAHSADDNRSTP